MSLHMSTFEIHHGMKITACFGIMVVCLALLTGCKGCEGCTDPTASNYDPDATKNCCCEYPGAWLRIEFHHMLNGVPFEFDKTTVNDVGVPYDFEIAQFFISNITLHQSFSEYLFTDDFCTDNHFVFVSPTQNEYTIGEFPPGTYTGISFTLGVDTAVNNVVFPAEACIAVTAGHPLQNTDMFWSLALGYLHLKIEGGVDTSSVPDAILDESLVVHVGTDPLARAVQLNYDFTGERNKYTKLDIRIEYGELLKGVNLRTDHHSQTTESPEALALATSVIDNAANMFSKW
jgi:hypothetical protein